MEHRLFVFINNHSSPVELVEVAQNSSSVLVKDQVLRRLSEIAGAFNSLEVMRAAHDLIGSDKSKTVDMKLLEPLLTNTLLGYEDALQDPVSFCQFIPSPAAGLDHELSMVQRMWKERFCYNCKSAVCKDGEGVIAATVKIGTRVRICETPSATIHARGRVR